MERVNDGLPVLTMNLNYVLESGDAIFLIKDYNVGTLHLHTLYGHNLWKKSGPISSPIVTYVKHSISTVWYNII